MRIDFPLLSVLSLGFLLFFALQGGDVELHSIELGIVTTPDGVRVTIDPAFFIYTDCLDSIGMQRYPAGSVGNVVFMRSYYKDHPSAYLTNWETNHLKQYRALGLWYSPAQFVLPLDPWRNGVNYDDPSEPNRIQWLPPDGFVDMWHFIYFDITHVTPSM